MHSDDIHIGRFRLRAVYRRVENDEGITIHVFGPAGAREEEVLRFDCFRSQPHYHLGWSYRDVPFTLIAASDPFFWALDQLACNANHLLALAEAEPMNDAEQSRLTSAVLQLRALGEQLVRADTRQQRERVRRA